MGERENNPIQKSAQRLAEKVMQVYFDELLVLSAEHQAKQLQQEEYDLLTNLLEHDMESLQLRLRLFNL